MTTDLITIIAEWRAAHPEAWPKGVMLYTSPGGLSCITLEMDSNELWEQAAALALIADAVLAEILQRDNVLEVSVKPADVAGILSVCVWRIKPGWNVYGEATTYLPALLLAERAMREGT